MSYNIQMALNMDYKYTICERNIQINKQAITMLESVKHHTILLLEARWEQRRCTRGSIGFGSMSLKFPACPHYINTGVHVDEICNHYNHPPPPPPNEVVGGILVSLSPSVHTSRIPCLLCSSYSSVWIHFIFIHHIKQLQQICCM